MAMYPPEVRRSPALHACPCGCWRTAAAQPCYACGRGRTMLARTRVWATLRSFVDAKPAIVVWVYGGILILLFAAAAWRY